MISDAEHEKRLALYKQGLSDGEIAETVCVARHTISAWRYKFNLPANPQHNFSCIPKEEHEKRMDLYQSGLSDGQIAKILFVSPVTIYQWRKRNGLKANFEPCGGTDNAKK